MYKYQEPTLTDLLVATLCSSRNLKVYYKILNDRQFARYKKSVVSSSLSRMNKKGFVSCDKEKGWQITEKGAKYYEKNSVHKYFSSPFSKDIPKNTIVIYDISEKDRKIRNWLRNQLKIFGYEIIQQSVWIGPGPLPGKFLDRLSIFGIKDKVKTFKVLNRK